MKKTFFKLLCAIPFIGLAACESNSELTTTTVKELDLAKYVGSWYEVARFDHRFERDLVGCKAKYTINEDGTVKVVNSGYKETLNGKYKESEGKARRPDAAKPGQLEV